MSYITFNQKDYILNEKQLRYMSRAILQDIKGLNPYEKKDVFTIRKNGMKFRVKHLVYGNQFWNDPNFEKWSHIGYPTPNINKLSTKEYSINFSGGYCTKEEEDTKITFNKNISEKDLYVMIAELHDKLKYINENELIGA